MNFATFGRHDFVGLVATQTPGCEYVGAFWGDTTITRWFIKLSFFTIHKVYNLHNLASTLSDDFLDFYIGCPFKVAVDIYLDASQYITLVVVWGVSFLLNL